MLTIARRNAILDTEFAASDKASLHTAYSATGTNEIASGGYARQTITWASGASASKSSTGNIDFTTASGDNVAWIGVWNSGGSVFRGMYPNGGSEKSFQVDLTNNRVQAEAHGLIDTDRVVFQGATLPTGVVEGTAYYVVTNTAADPDYFQVSATLAGAAIDLTGSYPGGDARFSKIVIDAYAATGTHRVTAITNSL